MTFEDRIRASFARQAMMATLGAQIDSVAQGAVTISVPLLPATSQQQGLAHGGLSFSIGDSAAGYSALSLLPLDREVVTSEMAIHYLAPGRGDRLMAKGHVIKPGRRQLIVGADVYAIEDGSKIHVATLRGTMVTVPA